MEANPRFNLENKLSSFLKHHATDTRAVHCLSLKKGCLGFVYLCNNLVQSYVEQFYINDAHKMFDEIPQPNVVSWTALISGYVRTRNLKNAVAVFRRMQQNKDAEEEDDLCPNQFTLGTILKGCTRAEDLETGVQIHCCAIKSGMESDTFLANVLVDMYAKCQKIKESWTVFAQTPNKNVVTWTSVITGLVSLGRDQFKDTAFRLFKDMICCGIWPLGVTFTNIIKIFDEPEMLNHARQVHGCMVKLGTEVDVHLGSALISMYGKCQGMDEAVRVAARLDKRDVVSWTSLLVAYEQNGFNVKAIEVVGRMVKEKIRLDSFVIASVIGACTAIEELAVGKEVHGYAVRHSFISDVSVGNAVITLYGRCGEVRKAYMMFRHMTEKDIISWTALLTCHVQNGYAEAALLLFQEMLQSGLRSPAFCVSSAIRACSMIARLSVGNQIHSRIEKTGFNTDSSVTNSLLTMYAKCGNIEAASRIFQYMIRRDTISWNAIIAGFSMHGFGKEALHLFYQMQREGLQPDDFTFLAVIAACSNVGLVAEGCEFFKTMTLSYNLEPKMEHYACMVDLFGRAAMLNDAIEFINSMPCDPGLLVWEALLASCKVHRNLDLGLVAAEKILQMRPEDPSAYITLSNIHASMGMWDRKADILTMMKDRGVKKEPSRSWVEIKGVVHAFPMVDKSHPLIHIIYLKLVELNIKMKEAGYVPNTNYVLHDIEQEQKEYSLLHHSEKLAVAFALVVTVKEIPIQVLQNLRCCGDCHTALKLISKIEDREIMLRDRNRFHHFIDGVCSCKDYW